MRKVDRHRCLGGKAPMVAHLLPLVIREGSAELGRQCLDGPDKGLPHRGGMLGLQRDQQGKPRGAFDESTQRRRIGMTDEQVAFPMPRHGARGHFGRPVINADHLLDGARGEPGLAGPPKAMTPPEVPGEGALEGVRGQPIKIAIDGFMRDLHRGVSRILLAQSMGNLFRRPALRQPGQDRPPESESSRELAGLPWLMGPPSRPLMGGHSAIGHQAGAVPSEFT